MKSIKKQLDHWKFGGETSLHCDDRAALDVSARPEDLHPKGSVCVLQACRYVDVTLSAPARSVRLRVVRQYLPWIQRPTPYHDPV